MTKVRIATWGLAPQEEYGVPVPRLHQHPLLNQLLLKLHTLIRRSSSDSPRTLSLSPPPRFLQEKQDTALITKKPDPAAPAMVNEVVQSNFLEGPQGSRNPNGENRRVNKTESGGWCSSGWKKLFLKALQTQYECKLFENIYSAGVRFYCACGEGE